MTSYKEYDSDLQQLKNQLTRNIGELDRLQGEERAKKIRQIEDNFNSLNELISEINGNIYIMEQNDRNKMIRALDDSRAQIKNLENRFREAQNRGELLGSNSPKTILEGGANSERQNLINQREKIQYGNNALQNFNDMAEEINATGLGTLNDLNDQKEKELSIHTNLTNLHSEVETGQRVADRMLCRQKKRTAILWIVIVLIVIVFLSVFLYFVFRP